MILVKRNIFNYNTLTIKKVLNTQNINVSCRQGTSIICSQTDLLSFSFSVNTKCFSSIYIEAISTQNTQYVHIYLETLVNAIIVVIIIRVFLDVFAMVKIVHHVVHFGKCLSSFSNSCKPLTNNSIVKWS